MSDFPRLTRCPHCQSTELRDEAIECERAVGESAFSSLIPAQTCASCGHSYPEGPALLRFNRAVARALVTSGVVSPEAFRFLRKTAGLKAAELADYLGVTAETVSRWETGKQGISRSNMLALGSLVLDEMEGRDDTKRRLSPPEKPALAGRTIQLALEGTNPPAFPMD